MLNYVIISKKYFKIAFFFCVWLTFRIFFSFFAAISRVKMLATIAFFIDKFQDKIVDSHTKFRNSVEKNHASGKFPPWKNLFSGNYCFYETKLPTSEKAADFSVTLYNFLVSAVISYCGSEVIVFRFYQKLNVVRSENSELSRGISWILPVFGKIIVYLLKMIKNLKNINCRKNSYFSN